MHDKEIQRVPTYAVFTTADPTTAIFGLCTCKWGIFVLVPLTQILRNAVFFQVSKSE